MDETKGTDTAAGAGEAGGRFSKAKEYVGDKVSGAADAIKDRYASASEAVKNRYSAVKEKVEDIDFGEVTEKVRDYVRSNPGKALLISVGVGFALGLMLRRSSRDDDE